MRILIHLFLISFMTLSVHAQSASSIDPQKQYEIGLDLYNGTSTVSKNPTEAVKWFTLSAKQGYDKAQDILGYCYYSGTGVEQNLTEAVKWYEKAANQDNRNAQRNLFVCYKYGRGCPKDNTKAIEWLLKAVENENYEAEYDLAKLLLDGDGIEKDTIAALNHLQNAASGGSPFIIYKDAYKPAEDLLLSFQNIQTSHKHHILNCVAQLYEKKGDCVKAESLYKQAIDLGSWDAMARLAIMYFYAEVTLHDLGVESSYMEANSANDFSKKWKREDKYSISLLLEKLINKGYGSWEYGSMPYSLYEFLVYVYETGVDTHMYRNLGEIEPEKATDAPLTLAVIKKILRIAKIASKDEDYSDIHNCLLWAEECYNNKYYDSESDKVVFEIYQNCNKTSGDSSYEIGEFVSLGLGRCYYKGRGTAKNEELARKYITEAAYSGSAEAMRLLSVFYRYGRCGLSVNEAKANEWNKKAMLAGSEQAQKLEELIALKRSENE